MVSGGFNLPSFLVLHLLLYSSFFPCLTPTALFFILSLSYTCCLFFLLSSSYTCCFILPFFLVLNLRLYSSFFPCLTPAAYSSFLPCLTPAAYSSFFFFLYRSREDLDTPTKIAALRDSAFVAYVHFVTSRISLFCLVFFLLHFPSKQLSFVLFSFSYTFHPNRCSSTHSVTLNSALEFFSFGLNEHGELGNGVAGVQALVKVHFLTPL